MYLRYILNKGLRIGSSHSESLVNSKCSDRVAVMCAIYANLDVLKQDRKFKSKLNLGIDDQGNVNISPYVRDYMSEFSKIHLEICQLLDRTVEKAEQVFLQLIKDHEVKFGASSVPLTLLQETIDGDIDKAYSMPTTLLGSRDSFNFHIRDLAGHYVTS